MKKDIEWLKSAIQQNLDFYNDNDEEWQMAKVRAYAKSLDLINQLDEPEVLSQEWIDEHSETFREIEESMVPLDKQYIDKVKVQKILVPKQELPVIPNYVAKWVSVHHEQFDLYPALRRLEQLSTRDRDVYEWYRVNTQTFVNAYLTGDYEVEEEQKYVIELPNITGSDERYLVQGDDGDLWIDGGLDYLQRHDLPKHTFTEEIKSFNPNYMVFAKKVEELE